MALEHPGARLSLSWSLAVLFVPVWEQKLCTQGHRAARGYDVYRTFTPGLGAEA